MKPTATDISSLIKHGYARVLAIRASNKQKQTIGNLVHKLALSGQIERAT